jgi:two-component system sensor histidine kinase KdpD
MGPPLALEQVEVRGALSCLAVVPVLIVCDLFRLPPLITAGVVAALVLVVAPVLTRSLSLLLAITAWACLTGFVTHSRGELAFRRGDLVLLGVLLVTAMATHLPRHGTPRARPSRQTGAVTKGPVPVGTMKPPAVIRRSNVSRERRRRAYLLAFLGLPALVGALVPMRSSLNLATDVLLFLLLVVVIALVGGRGPALVSAVAASLALNFFFTRPFHTWTIDDPNNALALVVFVLVAALVSWAVDLAAQRTRQAAEAAGEVEVQAAGNRLRTSLLAAVGHDLRTPLAVAKAGVSSLRSDEVELDASDRDELLAAADHALDRLAGLVDNLLDLSRLQTGALAVRRVPTAVGDVLARALDDVGVEPRAVVIDVPDDLPPALADPGLLERVLANLITNAQRHAASSVPPVVEAGAADGRIEVRIVDRGPGIPEDQRERIFQPFQRLGDTEAGVGVGLGLALARGLTEAMGGTVSPAVTEGGGLTMVVSLEAAGADALSPAEAGS